MTADVTDKREMMANQLLMRGHGTMLELMTASYGEWPPKGIEISENVFSNDSVNLADKASLVGGNSGGRNFAWAMMDKRSIEADVSYISRSTVSLTTILGHESTHILQGDARFRKERERGLISRMMDKFLGRKQEPNEAAPLVAMSNALMESFPSPFDRGGVSGEFAKVAAARNRPENVRFEYQNIKYMREGVEIQARLHEVMIDGYQRWGRLPATPDEFYAALRASGLHLPKDIHNRLDHLPEDSSARHFLTPDAVAAKAPRAAGELNDVSLSLPRAERQAFWQVAILGMYADLITMYGDKEGARKMGFEGNNLQKAVTAKADAARKEALKK